MQPDWIGFRALRGTNQTLVEKFSFLVLGGLSFAFSKLRKMKRLSRRGENRPQTSIPPAGSCTRDTHDWARMHDRTLLHQIWQRRPPRYFQSSGPRAINGVAREADIASLVKHLQRGKDHFAIFLRRPPVFLKAELSLKTSEIPFSGRSIDSTGLSRNFGRPEMLCAGRNLSKSMFCGGIPRYC